MKQFNIAKNQQIVFGHIFPKNAFYGKFTLNWEKTEKIGMKVIKDKNGHTRYNKNGMPIIRNQYKTTKMHNSCIYCVESLQTFKHKDRICLGAYVLFENAKTWQYMHLGGTKFLDELNKFIVRNILEYSHNIGVELIRLHAAIEEPCVNGSKIAKPHRRATNKFDNVFRMRPENVHVINENVTFNTHCSAASNLKKCKADTVTHERYASPYQWEYGATPKKSGNIEIVAAMNAVKSAK